MNLSVAGNSAIEALISNPMRSLLTMLGIIIGVASVMVMMSIGEGAKRQMQEQIASVGTNMLTVMPGSVTRGGRRGGWGSGRPFEESVVKEIEELPFVVAATGILNDQVTVVSENANWSTSIEGGSASYFQVNNWPLAEGREFTEQEVRSGSTVVVLGQTVYKELFPNGGGIGERVRLNSVPVTVIGVLSSKGAGGGMGQDRDDTIVGPLGMVRNRITGGSRWVSRHVNRIQFLVEDGYDMQLAQEETATKMREIRRIDPGEDDDFRFFNFADMIQQRAEQEQTMSMLLAFTAAVSLIVGGVGVMNIMLVSVTERTREIGLRMAIGARGGDILTQFLVEAITLCTFGGLVGMAIGWIGAYAFAQVGGWPFAVSPAMIGISLGAAAFVGVVFGFFPARRAAQLDPIQALRHD